MANHVDRKPKFKQRVGSYIFISEQNDTNLLHVRWNCLVFKKSPFIIIFTSLFGPDMEKRLPTTFYFKHNNSLHDNNHNMYGFLFTILYSPEICIITTPCAIL